MPAYSVCWEVEVDAETPHAAAEAALEMQRDPVSTATVFQVFDAKTFLLQTVDLQQPENP